MTVLHLNPLCKFFSLFPGSFLVFVSQKMLLVPESTGMIVFTGILWKVCKVVQFTWKIAIFGQKELHLCLTL